MLLIGVLCLVSLAVLGLAAAPGPLPIDVSIRAQLHAGESVPPLLQTFNDVGQPLIWDSAVAVLVAALVIARQRVEAGWIGGGLVLGEVLATIVKVIVDRPRPPGVSVGDFITQASYPSGHVTRAALTGALILLVWRGPGWSRLVVAVVAVVVAVVMGLARIVAGEHWPTDVAGAYLLVGAIAAAPAAFPERLRRPVPARPARPAFSPGEAARRP
jgi:membrane-associated phospholipid phosphatase